MAVSRGRDRTLYFPSYGAARAFAQKHGHPTARIISYGKGWAIQGWKSGPYVTGKGALIPDRYKPNSSVPDEGPIEHLKNAAAIIQANLELGDKDALVADDAKAVLARIKTALQQLEQRGHVYMGLPRRENRRSVRRGNPALAVLNPRVADATLATWAKIEYMRPDDPDGSDVVRVHEFSDGFEIAWLSDGSVQLSHPRHPLWTDDSIGRA